MIRVYYLKVLKDDATNTEYPKGIKYIHNAILECTEKPNIRKLIQDTTDTEHTGLIVVAESWRQATQDEIEQLNTMKARFPITPPPRDALKEIDELKARIGKLEKMKPQ